MEVITTRVARQTGFYETVFKTTEKEEAEVDSKQREVTKGGISPELMSREPWGRFYESGRNFTYQTSLQGSRVLKRLNMVCTDIRGNRCAGLLGQRLETEAY